MSLQLCGWKCLVDVRGQRRMDRLVRDDRKATVTQITTRYNQDLQNTISEHTTHRTLKQMGSSSRRPHRVSLLSDKNRKQRLQFTQTHQNWTKEDWKTLPDLMSLDFCCDIQMVESEFGVLLLVWQKRYVSNIIYIFLTKEHISAHSLRITHIYIYIHRVWN